MKTFRLLTLSMVLFRLLSAQPQTDGEHWKIAGHFHNDDWHVDSYGQNPAPFYRNPFLSPDGGVPLPWHPNGRGFQHDDALFPGERGFRVDTVYAPNADGSTRLSVNITGQPPVNVLSKTTTPPLVPLQATTANTGGGFDPGDYAIKLVGVDSDGLLSGTSHLIHVTIPTGTSTNTITISGIVWDANAVNYILFIGPNVLEMSRRSSSFAVSSTITMLGYTANPTFGPPDLNFARFRLRAKEIVHGGVWGTAVSVVTSTTIKVTGAGWTVNQWAGRVVTLYGSLAPGLQDPENFNVTSNTADTLTVTQDPTLLVQVGDALVMRTQLSAVTGSTITDSSFVNSFGSGLALDAEIGNLIYVIAGTGAGQPPAVIVGNTATTLTISGSWTVTPDATSVWIVARPTWTYDVLTAVISHDGVASGTGVVGSLPIDNLAGKSVLIQAITADTNGNISPARYAPFRELYLFGNAGYYPVTNVAGVATIDQANGNTQVVSLPNDGSLLTITMGGIAPSAGNWLSLFIRTPATGTWQTPAFTGGANGFASDVVAGTRYTSSAVASTQDELDFTFHGAGTTATMANPSIGGAIS